MKKVLENILQPLIGVLMLVLYFVWAINSYPQYLREMTITCAILSCATIANRMVDVIIEHLTFLFQPHSISKNKQKTVMMKKKIPG